MIFDKPLIDSIGANLKNKNLTISVAESVTSGLLQTAFSNANDASKFFQGGITAYNIGQKSRHLLVEPLHAIECNCISEKIAQDMSRHVCNLFLSDYGIGITGYAAKMPDKDVNELFAYYAISENDTVLKSGKIITNAEEGFSAQLFYVNEVLKTLKEILNN